MSSRYHSMHACIEDLEKAGQLIRVTEEIDPKLELAEIHRRVYRGGGGALLFEKVKGSTFPCVSNIYGSDERVEYIFRSTVRLVEKAIRLRTSPPEFLKGMATDFWKNPFDYLQLPFTGITSLPRRMKLSTAPVAQFQTDIESLPKIVSWPRDGGAFITLPQVFSRDPQSSSIMKSNLGMYRVQLSGNEYQKNKEVGVHYQIHRGLGVHHQTALDMGVDLPVSIFVGGPPAHTFAAVMPLPENLSELLFAGMLSGRRFRYALDGEHVVSADADFCITGWIRGKKTKREGPFGDHLGYYSLDHEFPYLEVEKVYHRKNAVWPLTVVGRPPQEDTHFGSFIHKLTGDIVSHEIPGIKALHAVDASGVHPLLLAIGSERYTPYSEGPPKELLTQSHAILGFNQCSLAKYLFLMDESDRRIDIHDVRNFIQTLLKRVDFSRDLHFQTKTTMDTLDYSSDELNYGSKLAIVVNGPDKRLLASELPVGLSQTEDVKKLVMLDKGILAAQLSPFTTYENEKSKIARISQFFEKQDLSGFALIVLCDDADFLNESFNNFIWATFTRSNPSHDIYGVGESYHFKHWSCTGPLMIDARIKPHHAPELLEDPEVSRRADRVMAKSPQLKKFIGR